MEHRQYNPNGFLLRLKNRGIRLFRLTGDEVRDTLYSIPGDYEAFRDLDFNQICFVCFDVSALACFEDVPLTLQKLNKLHLCYRGNEDNTVDDLLREKGLDGLIEVVCDFMGQYYPQVVSPGGYHFAIG